MLPIHASSMHVTSICASNYFMLPIHASNMHATITCASNYFMLPNIIHIWHNTIFSSTHLQIMKEAEPESAVESRFGGLDWGIHYRDFKKLKEISLLLRG
jgi:hypothetical protein